MKSTGEAVVALILALLCCAGGLVIQAKAPCWVFSLTSSAEVPARCLSTFTK